MNILCIGYYDKHSRFYLAIKKELSNHINNLSFKINSIHFSGFLYTFLRFKFSCWLPVKAWALAKKNKKKYLSIIDSTDEYKNIHYKKLIKYHSKLNDKISKEHLLIQSLAYLDIFEDYFAKNKPDAILLIGDSRLCIETCIAMGKQKKIKLFYIEQGPFSSTIFNDEGVNANINVKCDFNSTVSIETKKNLENYLNDASKVKYHRSYVYRVFDFLLYSIFSKSNSLFPPDLKHTDTIPINISLKKRDTLLNFDKIKKTFLLILQVPLDVNMIYHSPFFNDHFSIVKTIHENLPSSSQLILREHPIYKNKYGEELYNYAEKHNLMFDTNKSIKDSFKFSDIIIVNNSTAGLEAISQMKKTVVLGSSYYNKPELCIKYNPDDIKGTFAKALDFEPNENYVFSFLSEFLENNTVQGAIDDKNLAAAKSISYKIQDYLQLN